MSRDITDSKGNCPDIEKYLRLLRSNVAHYAAARLAVEMLDDYDDKMYAAVFAPTLTEYVIWVLDRAVHSGIKRLYFLSRDAYPMYVATQALAEAEGLDLDIRYLRVSRYALRIPEYHLLKDECLDRIFISGIDVSLNTILKRAGLTYDQICQVVQETGTGDILDDVLNRTQILRLRDDIREKCLRGKCSLLDMIYEKSAEAFGDTVGYLRQEGLLDDIKYAVVDSGWVGSIQKSIQNILAAIKPGIEVSGYYFGLYELPADRAGCSYEAFYFMPKGAISRKARFSNCMYEVIYSEPKPMVVGYAHEDDRYIPVLSDTDNPNSEYLIRNEEVLRMFIRIYIEDKKIFSVHTKKSPKKALLTSKIYRKFMSAPGEWEAEHYGRRLFSDDISDEKMKPAANDLSQDEIKDLGVISKLAITAGLSDKAIHESAWIEGSIVNAKGPVRRNLFRARIAKYLTALRQSMKAGRNRDV